MSRLHTCLATLVIACSPAAPRRGATVMYASGADLQTINPLLAIHPFAKQVQRYVLLTTLVRYDSALVVQPYLARKWWWSPDRRTLTFMLRTDVRWHDGQLTVAEDVRWTLDAARDPATGYPRWNDLSGLQEVAAPDDSTVVLRFRGPGDRVPDVLTDLAILPSHLLDTVPPGRLRQARWNQHPVGNGPFRFVAHEPHRRWVFTANPDFPGELGGPPRLQRLVVAVVDEPTTKLAALTSGELDFAGINAAHAPYVRQDPDLALLDYPLLFTYGLVFNTRTAPFNSLAVRRAVGAALDRREIVQGYTYGFSVAATGPVPPGVPGYLPSVAAPMDADSARRLLAGQRVSFELLTVGSGEAPLEQMVQAQLARAGFVVSIRQLELSAFLDRVYGPRREFEAASMGIPGDLSLGYLTSLAQLTGMPVPADPAGAQQVFADSMPVAFLFHARGVNGMNRRVHGVRMDLRGELPTVAQWWVDDRR